MASQTPETLSLTEIIAATDFSATASAAVGWAMEIARAHGARLTLLHTVSSPTPSPGYFGPQEDWGQQLRELARTRLEEAAAQLAGQGVEIVPRLMLGLPSAAILEAAEELPADLVVLGTRGLSGLAHLLLGSTAERVVQRAPCPVLTTHGGHLEQLETILVPTDFSGNARRAARAACALLGSGGRLVLFNAYHLPIEYTAYGTVPVTPAFLEESRVRAEADLGELAGELAGDGVEVETLAAAGYPVESILEAADEVGADLIAMGTRGLSGAAHLLLGSTAERVVQRAGCPVLTLRQEELRQEELRQEELRQEEKS